MNQQVRGVIDITTAILPICALALSVKDLFFVLAFFSQYGDGTFLSDAHFLLRLVRKQLNNRKKGREPCRRSSMATSTPCY